MNKNIKNGLLQGIIGAGTMLIIGITYAATVSSGEPLTAQLFNEKTVPTGAVMSFALGTCPIGWSEYLPAQGRFIRGVDKTDTNIDPDGERSIGDIQDDAFQGHWHNSVGSFRTTGAGSYGLPAGGAVPLGTVGIRDAISDGVNGTPRISSETRPTNISLLYCIKN